MTLRKWNFKIEGFSGMNYYCVVHTFDEAVVKAKKQAEQLKETQGLEELPDIVSIDVDRGDYVE